ncbi:MAG: tetratricopeptide repeat protein [Deltaproteobacteria bacterium]|nr:tetratricopeptide repeat protein [Deltaproteobacteria bacterium]
MNTHEPARPGQPEPQPDTASGAVLQLAATSGHLSLELQAPTRVGPIVVSSLIMSLPGLRFPVDLSGGVPRFRHRRGALEALGLRVSLAKLAEHLAPRVRNVLGPGPCDLAVLPSHQGIVFGLHQDSRALAFTALFAPDDDCIRWVVTDARASGMAVHSHGAALRAAEAIVGKLGRRQGSLIVFDRAIPKLVRELLIDAGARAPDTSGLRFTDWQETAEGFELAARRDAPIPVPSPGVIRAIEAARLAEEADDAIARGDVDVARSGYLKALEHAPRHPDLSLRFVEIDLLAGNRPESALGLLIEAMPAVDGGLVAARLLAAAGDQEGAMVACRQASEREPFAKLASMLLVEASGHANVLRDRLALLDDAVSRSPGLVTARWERARARLSQGDAKGAAADLEHIEAATHGSAHRFDACYEAGRTLLEARVPAEASRFFQKALRYVPSSPDASAGLARALLAVGDGPRAVALLSRAVGLAKRAEPPPGLLLELATALAEITHDLPAAIAHARSVPFGVPETVAARVLEGRWRAVLGDIVGASQAYAQAREALESMPSAAEIASDWLVEAARFELDVRHDPRTAQAHLVAALQRHPRDPSARSLFRRVGSLLAGLDEPPAAAKPEVASRDPDPSPAPSAASLPEDDEAEIPRLTQAVQGNPNDREAVAKLCLVLERVGRHLDLFALVSARLEESTSQDDVAMLRRYRRSALQSLAKQARDAGRVDEAALYEQALEEPDAPQG